MSSCSRPNGDHSLSTQRAIAELRAALAPKPKSSLRKKTERKRRKKGAETKAIRAEVMVRARGRCEGCGYQFTPSNPAQLDHFFGKARIPQTARNTWALHATCHSDKTANKPSAAHWLTVFRAHANSHGFLPESAMAKRRYESIELIGQAEGVATP